MLVELNKFYFKENAHELIKTSKIHLNKVPHRKPYIKLINKRQKKLTMNQRINNNFPPTSSDEVGKNQKPLSKESLDKLKQIVTSSNPHQMHQTKLTDFFTSSIRPNRRKRKRDADAIIKSRGRLKILSTNNKAANKIFIPQTTPSIRYEHKFKKLRGNKSKTLYHSLRIKSQEEGNSIQEASNKKITHKSCQLKRLISKKALKKLRRHGQYCHQIKQSSFNSMAGKGVETELQFTNELLCPENQDHNKSSNYDSHSNPDHSKYSNRSNTNSKNHASYEDYNYDDFDSDNQNKSSYKQDSLVDTSYDDYSNDEYGYSQRNEEQSRFGFDVLDGIIASNHKYPSYRELDYLESDYDDMEEIDYDNIDESDNSDYTDLNSNEFLILDNNHNTNFNNSDNSNSDKDHDDVDKDYGDQYDDEYENEDDKELSDYSNEPYYYYNEVDEVYYRSHIYENNYENDIDSFDLQGQHDEYPRYQEDDYVESHTGDIEKIGYDHFEEHDKYDWNKNVFPQHPMTPLCTNSISNEAHASNETPLAMHRPVSLITYPNEENIIPNDPTIPLVATTNLYLIDHIVHDGKPTVTRNKKRLHPLCINSIASYLPSPPSSANGNVSDSSSSLTTSSTAAVTPLVDLNHESTQHEATEVGPSSTPSTINIQPACHCNNKSSSTTKFDRSNLKLTAPDSVAKNGVQSPLIISGIIHTTTNQTPTVLLSPTSIPALVIGKISLASDQSGSPEKALSTHLLDTDQPGPSLPPISSTTQISVSRPHSHTKSQRLLFPNKRYIRSVEPTLNAETYSSAKDVIKTSAGAIISQRNHPIMIQDTSMTSNVSHLSAPINENNIKHNSFAGKKNHPTEDRSTILLTVTSKSTRICLSYLASTLFIEDFPPCIPNCPYQHREINAGEIRSISKHTR